MQNIHRLEAGVPLGALAVDLHPLEADVLLQQGRGKEGQILGDKTVQTLPGVVFSDGELPHGGPPESVLSIIPVLRENVKNIKEESGDGEPGRGPSMACAGLAGGMR